MQTRGGTDLRRPRHPGPAAATGVPPPPPRGRPPVRPPPSLRHRPPPGWLPQLPPHQETWGHPAWASWAGSVSGVTWRERFVRQETKQQRGEAPRPDALAGRQMEPPLTSAPRRAGGHGALAEAGSWGQGGGAAEAWGRGGGWQGWPVSSGC